ncbi:MAG TPA: hypothetical protein VNT32_07510 [Thermoleophilaceae bacterium]|nr:hypothetical protein [Thermoleophilaceae bacterium]
MRTLVTATLCTLAAGLAALAPAASADEQQPLPPDQRYDGACGHLGNDCGAGSDEPRARAPRSRGGAAMRASGRVRVSRQRSRRPATTKSRSAERPRRAGARR